MTLFVAEGTVVPVADVMLLYFTVGWCYCQWLMLLPGG